MLFTKYAVQIITVAKSNLTEVLQLMLNMNFMQTCNFVMFYFMKKNSFFMKKLIFHEKENLIF